MNDAEIMLIYVVMLVNVVGWIAALVVATLAHARIDGQRLRAQVEADADALVASVRRKRGLCADDGGEG